MLHYNNNLDKVRDEYRKLLAEKDNRLVVYEQTSRVGQVLVADVAAGEAIRQEDVQQKALPDYMTPMNLVASPDELVGKVMKIDALAGTAITEDMLYAEGELDPSLRREEAQYIRLPIRVQRGDIVDVRIVYPNGEDYVVLAKKKLDDVDPVLQLSYFNVNEEERQLLNSSLVDAYTNKAELYAIQYVEPEMQPKAVVTYMPNVDVMRVLRSNPNIIDKAKLSLNEEVRKGLDARLHAIPEDRKQRIAAQAPDGGSVSRRVGAQGALPILAAPAPSSEAQSAAVEPATAPQAADDSGSTGLLEGE